MKPELEGSCGPFPMRRGSEEVKGMVNTHEALCQVRGVWLDIDSFDLTPTVSPTPSFLWRTASLSCQLCDSKKLSVTSRSSRVQPLVIAIGLTMVMGP